MLLFKRRHDPAIAELEKARALNPDLVDHRYGLGLIYAREPAKAIAVLQANSRSIRYSATPATPISSAMPTMCFKRYAEAVPLLRSCGTRA